MTVINIIIGMLYIINLQEKKKQESVAVPRFFNRIKPLWLLKRYA